MLALLVVKKKLCCDVKVRTGDLEKEKEVEVAQPESAE